MKWIVFPLVLLLLVPRIGSCATLITGTFVDADIREVIGDIAKQSGINIIVDNTVQGIVTLDLKDVTLEKALEMVTSSGGYAYCKKDGYYIVGSPDIKDPSFGTLTKTVFYTPRYVSTNLIIQRMGDSFSPFVKANEDLNTISITAPETLINDILYKLKEMDTPSRVILVEAVLDRGYINSQEDSSIEWNLGWKIGSNEVDGVSGISFKDLKLGYIYKNNNDISLLLKSLEKKEGLVQLAHSKSIVLEGESTGISFEQEFFVNLDGETVSYSPISSVFSVNMHPVIRDKKVRIDVRIESDYITDASTKKSGGATTSIELTEDKVAIIGGVIEERESLSREGMFSPIIPSGGKSRDSFTIFLSSRIIPEYDDASMVFATQLDTYKKELTTEDLNTSSKGLVLSGYPVSIADIGAKDPLHPVIRSGLKIDGILPIDMKNTLSLSALYLPDGAKTGKIEIDYPINNIDTSAGLGYRVFTLDPVSLNCLYVLIDGKTYPMDNLSLNGKLFGILLKDNREDSVKGTVGLSLSSQYKVSEDVDLNLEYFRTYQKDILSSLRLELGMKLKSLPKIIIGYDLRGSIYQDNLLDDSYGRGVYLRIDWKF